MHMQTVTSLTQPALTNTQQQLHSRCEQRPTLVHSRTMTPPCCVARTLKNVCHLLVELSDKGWSSGISAFSSCSRRCHNKQHTDSRAASGPRRSLTPR
jgi:hypothetical protein